MSSDENREIAVNNERTKTCSSKARSGLLTFLYGSISVAVKPLVSVLVRLVLRKLDSPPNLKNQQGTPFPDVDKTHGNDGSPLTKDSV